MPLPMASEAAPTAPQLGVPITKRNQHRIETQATWEKRWREAPEQFDPDRDARERFFQRATQRFLDRTINLKEKKMVDLGAGSGRWSKYSLQKGAQVTALDVAKNALDQLPGEIEKVHGCLPVTQLSDRSYDLVIAADILGDLPKRDHRLFVSELSRLAKREGKIFLSVSVDSESWDVLHRLDNLLQTDLVVEEWQLLHCGYQMRLERWLELPDRLARRKSIARSKTGRRFEKWLMALPIWRIGAKLTRPLLQLATQSDGLLRHLEKLGARISPDQTTSHLLAIARPKTLELPDSSKWKRK